MKRVIIIISALIALNSCDVYHFGYDVPREYEPVELAVTTSIADLKAMYTTSKMNITDELVIGGQVISSDETGNIYKSLYIQDATGAIEVKLGKTGLYNDFCEGQWVYVKCKGLTLGTYGGMVQLGYRDESGSYETAYLDHQYLIDAHVFRGKKDTPVAPLLIDEAGLKNPENYGRLVRVEGLTYGKEVFCILYDSAGNSLYLSDKQCGLTTWAMTQNGFKKYMTQNGKEEPQSAFDGMITADNWKAYYDAATAYSVSQYFKIGKTDLQVRTSGYAKFADTAIPDEVIAGAKVNFTGILTIYNSNIQFTLISLDGVEIVK